MKRRTVLRNVGLGAMAMSGVGTATAQTEGSDGLEASLEVISDGSAGGGGADIRVDCGTTTRVRGTILGNDSCYTATLGDVSVSGGTLRIEVDSTSTREPTDLCLTAIWAINYEVTVSGLDTAPSAVTVVHNTNLSSGGGTTTVSCDGPNALDDGEEFGPFGSDPFGGSGDDPFGGDPFGGGDDPFGGDPFGSGDSDPFGGDPFGSGSGGSLFEDDPFGSGGSDPFGSDLFGGGDTDTGSLFGDTDNSSTVGSLFGDGGDDPFGNNLFD